MVPTEDLLKLRESLRQVQKLGGPGAAEELLTLLDQELHRRGYTPHKGQPFRARSWTD